MSADPASAYLAPGIFVLRPEYRTVTGMSEGAESSEADGEARPGARVSGGLYAPCIAGPCWACRTRSPRLVHEARGLFCEIPQLQRTREDEFCPQSCEDGLQIVVRLVKLDVFGGRHAHALSALIHCQCDSARCLVDARPTGPYCGVGAETCEELSCMEAAHRSRRPSIRQPSMAIPVGLSRRTLPASPQSLRLVWFRLGPQLRVRCGPRALEACPQLCICRRSGPWVPLPPTEIRPALRWRARQAADVLDAPHPRSGRRWHGGIYVIACAEPHPFARTLDALGVSLQHPHEATLRPGASTETEAVLMMAPTVPAAGGSLALCALRICAMRPVCLHRWVLAQSGGHAQSGDHAPPAAWPTRLGRPFTVAIIDPNGLARA